MKKVIYQLVFIVIIFFSCSKEPVEKEKKIEKKKEIVSKTVSIKIKEKNLTPTVNIPYFILITDSMEPRVAEATEIIKLKRRWPLALQSLDKIELEEILTKNFTYSSAKEGVMNREDYIKNRTTKEEWTILHMDYYDILVQFFGDVAVMSYRNKIKNENTTTKKIELEEISSVDIYSKEENVWKIEGTQVIENNLIND